MATVEQKLLTAEEFMNLPEPRDGSKQELVRGVVITMPPPRFRHGKYQFLVAKRLDSYVGPRHLGQVITETGLVTERGPDTVRGPDVAYWSKERLPLDQEPEGYPDVAADLCVEILSPGEAKAEIQDKVREYFDCGVRMVWYVDPVKRTVTVYRPGVAERLLQETDLISGEDVIPGFSCTVAELLT
jgi:Uma2 family endonuclease